MLKRKFKEIIINDIELINEIDEIRDKKQGYKAILEDLAKSRGRVEKDNSKWWDKVKKIYKIFKIKI